MIKTPIRVEGVFYTAEEMFENCQFMDNTLEEMLDLDPIFALVKQSSKGEYYEFFTDGHIDGSPIEDEIVIRMTLEAHEHFSASLSKHKCYLRATAYKSMYGNDYMILDVTKTKEDTEGVFKPFNRCPGHEVRAAIHVREQTRKIRQGLETDTGSGRYRMEVEYYLSNK